MRDLNLTELPNIVRKLMRSGVTCWTVKLYQGLSQNRNLFGKLLQDPGSVCSVGPRAIEVMCI
jgi:hypothetical protein